MAGGLVVAGVVDGEVADELVVDEYRCVVVVDDDGGVGAGVGDAEPDAEGAVESDVAG